MLNPQQTARLAELEAAFAEAGGRGVDLAEEIDALRALRDRIVPRGYDSLEDWARDSDYVELNGLWFDRDSLRDFDDAGPVDLETQFLAAIEGLPPTLTIHAELRPGVEVDDQVVSEAIQAFADHYEAGAYFESVTSAWEYLDGHTTTTYAEISPPG
jgi:hypothetical protein